MLHFAAKYNNNRPVAVRGNSAKNDQEWDNVSHKISTEYCEHTWEVASAEGYTPVHVAAYYGNNAFIQYVNKKVDYGKDYILQPTQNIRKMNILHICAEHSISSPEEKQNNEKKCGR